MKIFSSKLEWDDDGAHSRRIFGLVQGLHANSGCWVVKIGFGCSKLGESIN